VIALVAHIEKERALEFQSSLAMPRLKKPQAGSARMSDIEALSQVMKAPYMLVSNQTGLVFPYSMLPDEVTSDLDPPGWAERDERWSIDGLLGLYDSKLKKITIFSKGIGFAAEKLNVSAEWLNYIVRIHEWGHGVFHLGSNPASARSLTSVDLTGDTPLRELVLASATNIYQDVDDFVHEQIAQAITFLTLEGLRGDATVEEAKRACASLMEIFNALTSYQAPKYRLDDLRHLETDRMRERVRGVVRLIHSRAVQGDEKTWKTLMGWR
jgi:hypothetical protein